MKRNKVIAVLLVFAVILCAMLVACNDKCTEHVDADGDLKCDNCGAEVTPSTDDGNTDGGNTDGGNTDGGNTDGGNGDGGNTDGGNGGGNTIVTYTVNVKSIGGMPLENVLTYVWQGDEYMDYGKTNSNGQATISLPIASNYKVTLQSVPDGYVVNDAGYSFTGRTANITLTSQVIPNPNNSLPSPYKLGDIMQDFTVTTSEGTTYTLSEELKTHDLVMINFWYTTCTYCVAEFPYMVEQYGAYQNGVDGALYSDDVSIIALNTYSEDNEEDVDLFKFNHGLNFDVAKADPAYFNAFPTEGYPTSVFVDRYGVICCIEIGGMTYTKPFKAAFDHFIGDDYEQKLLTSIGELTPIPKPNITQAESSVIANAFVKEGSAFEVTFRPESDTADAEYAWPFIIGEKDGRTVLTTPIHDMDSSYAIIHMDIPLTAGQAVGMDYFCSSEISSDILYVLVNGNDILQISGESEAWKTCYPYVADEDGTYTITLIFLKDSDQAYADKNTLDNIFVDNLHIVNNADQAGNITVPTYIPREAATHPDKYGLGFQNYITPVFNNEDGYYHVGEANGPLLLANMMGYSNFSATESVYTYAYNDKVIEGGVNYGAEIINQYCNYSSNAKINGFCTVNQRLRELLEIVARVNKNNEANTWLQFCSYYDAYGTEEELQDPIRGLAPFSAYDTILNATAGLDEFPNEVTYDRVVMPRGYWYAFTPTVSGAYRIESKSTQEVDGWIFQYDYDKNESIQLYEYDHY
ncbi:MAG: TlpA family protein disulfide reductase, partial [Clostridia bacterium]|nr:TlpA family protein disulfide reductase [Clostridia bacterium]